MNLKKQVNKIKENWLIVALILILVFMLNFSGNSFGSKGDFGIGKKLAIETQESAGGSIFGRIYDDEDFAPEAEERLKTITASLSTEIKRGEFMASQERLKGVLSEFDAFLLNENVRKSEKGFFETSSGSYTIKIAISNYDGAIAKLKEIGEIRSFNENTEDITQRYINLQTELELEKERLSRYKIMYLEAKEISDKIELSDRIFNQERTIKYLEDRVDNLDKKIDYATVYLYMNEKQSDYAHIVLVSLSDLVRTFVNSVNSLLRFIFIILPWIIVLSIVRIFYKKFKKHFK